MEKKIEKIINEIKKKYGEESIMTLSEENNKNIESVSSGSLLIDDALGIGGYPKGRIIEIYGPESSGKTTLALHGIAEVQKSGGVAAFIDAEHALDPKYAKNLGVDLDNLILSQPNTGEEALEIVDNLVETGEIGIIVIDSVAALTPKVEIEGEMGDSHVGLQARLMSQALRKLGAKINQTNTIVLFINQLREKVGILFGNPEVTPGGRALKFYSSIRIDVRKKESIKNGANIEGNKTNVKIVKNKLAPPFKNVEIDIIYGKGISKIGEIVDLGVEYDLIEKSGAWYTIDGEKIAQGRENAKLFLEANPKIKNKIEKEIISELQK